MMLSLSLAAQAQHVTTVGEALLTGPYDVTAPAALDTVDINGKKFDNASLLDALPLQVTDNATVASLQSSLSASHEKQVGLLTFFVNNSDYLKGKLKVEGLKTFKTYVDGRETADLTLAPEHHTVSIKFLTEPADSDTLRVTIDADRPVVTTVEKQHPYMFHDLTDGRRVRSVATAPDGSMVVVGYQTTTSDGKSQWRFELRRTKDGQLLKTLPANVRWMPRTVAWLEEEQSDGRRQLFRTDPFTGERTLIATNVPKGSYVVSPTEDYLIITVEDEGPKEDEQVFQVLEMDDRQPGWRSRSHLCKLDLATGLCQRITFGTKGESLADISADGSKLLIATSYSRLSRRPTEVMDLYVMDAQTFSVDTLLQCEGFVGQAQFSPDARQLLIVGTPEAFDRIGCQLPVDRTPSMTENELFLYDIATKKVTPLTKDFDPSVNGSPQWSLADGNIYFSAEHRDYVYLYQLDPKTGKTQQLPCSGDYIYRWDMAAQATTVAWLAYNTMEPASAYVAPLPTALKGKSSSQKGGAPTLRSVCLFDGKTALGDAQVGTCQDWNFTNSKGDTVYGRLYLPNDFDESKQYPLIVYYYGGCSPVSRYFESPYAPQLWNSLGYIAYILQPSGATGFGQEWASRHVNTAGRGPAEDIIEGTRQLCASHAYINKEKIGCMGASYGGFMTQYLQTQTDIFAAAVSHAGIANHTSYWGEGYWGYNYSEVSMANSYPWSHRQLYVDQSPLFNADKIHTPLLLLHGTADTNVPIIESLQMFTALKLLGREVALVEVQGENHHVLDYQKKLKWLATQMAWFQRWLKDDPSWWDALYPQKHL